MLLTDAVNLIENGVAKEPSTWADLGCGNGLFTQALAQLLPTPTTIHAVDINAGALNKIQDQYNDVKVMKHKYDFVNDPIVLPALDGILMANSLHFVQDKKSFLKKIELLLQPAAKMILVEYELTNANQWVPFPIQFHELKTLFSTIRFSNITKIGEMPSAYHQASIYAALLKKPHQA